MLGQVLAIKRAPTANGRARGVGATYLQAEARSQLGAVVPTDAVRTLVKATLR